MRRLLLVCALLSSACGEEVEEPKPVAAPAALTVTIGEKVCQRDLGSRLYEGTLIFRVNARIEADVPLSNFSCRTRNSEGASITCSGPPADLNAAWEGVLVCETGNWNSDGRAVISCGGSPFGDDDQSVSSSSAGWDELYTLRQCDAQQSG